VSIRPIAVNPVTGEVETEGVTGDLAVGGDLSVSGITTIYGYFGAGGNMGLGSAPSLVGFFGATPAARPTVTGSRGGNAAVASLLTALETLGLIVDDTTA